MSQAQLQTLGRRACKLFQRPVQVIGIAPEPSRKLTRSSAQAIVGVDPGTLLVNSMHGASRA